MRSFRLLGCSRPSAVLSLLILLNLSPAATAQTTGPGSGPAHWVVTFECQGANTGNPDTFSDPNPGPWPATITPDSSNPGLVEFDEASEIPGGSGALSADSTGTITPVLTWTPGFAGVTTPPPTKAVAVVYSCAEAADDHYGWQSPGSTHEEVDAQSDTPTSYAYSYFSDGYQVLTQDNTAGATKVKLQQLTLHAKGTYPSNGNTDTIFAAVSVDVYPVTVTLTGTTPANGALEALTGQQITATLNAPFQVDPNSYAWSVSGGMFKDFDWTLSSNQKTELTDADYFQSSFTFYDATRETLNLIGYATVICPDNTRLNVNTQQPITILKPTETTWGVNTSPSPLGPYSWNYAPPNGNGPFDPRYGVQVTWNPINITVPTPFTGGTACIAQIVTSTNRVDTRNGLNGGPSTTYVPLMPNPNGDGTMIRVAGGLDTGFPYHFVYQLNTDGTIHYDANGNAGVFSPPQWDVGGPAAAGDSPGLECEPTLVSGDTNDDWRSSTANDQFNTWTMYRPPSKDGQGTVWVPLQQLSWGWSGSASVATDQAGDPSLDNQGHAHWNFTGPTISPAGTPSDTVEFPEWTAVIPLSPAMGPAPAH